MASRPVKKVSFNSVVENNSLSPESPSFSGLICIQDQIPKGPPISGRQTRAQDIDFEFSQTINDPNHGINPSKYPPADLLISNGKIIPREFEFQPKQQRPGTRRAGGISRAKEGSGRQKRGQRNQVVLKEHKTKSGSGFGSKLFKSFASPCKECKAIKPQAVMTKTRPRKACD